MNRFNDLRKFNTKLILKIDSIFPKLFPAKYKRTVELLKKECVVDDSKKENASLFEGDFSWVGINVALKISEYDLDKINKWLRNHPTLFPRDYTQLNNSFDSGGGYRNLGYFIFDKENRYINTHTIMNETSLYCSYCTASIHYLHYGNTYLNLYFKLNEKSTRMIKDIPIKKIKGKKYIVSILPWSRYFFSMASTTQTKIIERLIRKNFNTVVNDVNSSMQAILKTINIKEKETKIVFSEYIRESNEKYFSNSRTEYDEKYQYLIQRYGPESERYKVKDSNSEFFIENEMRVLNGLPILVDGHCIKRTIPDYEDFTLLYSHNYLSVLFMIKKEYLKIIEITDSVLLNRIQNIKKKYTLLNMAEVRIQKLKEELKAFDMLIKYDFDSEKLLPVISESKYLMKLINQHHNTILHRMKSVDNEIQIENITFTKRNSYFISILVIFQVALALISLKDFSYQKLLIYIKILWQLP